MTIAPTRTAIIEAFERHRATPGAPYEDSHFLDFLMESPKAKGAFRNSFVGLRHFNAFIDEIQYQYGVCLSLEERDRDHSIDSFVERVKQLQKSRKGSLRSLKNQERAGAGWGIVVVADILLIGIAASVGGTPAVFAFITLAVGITAIFSAFAHRNKAYLRRLRSKIEQA